MICHFDVLGLHTFYTNKNIHKNKHTNLTEQREGKEDELNLRYLKELDEKSGENKQFLKHLNLDFTLGSR